MPPQSRLKKILSSIKKQDKSPKVVEDGEETSHTMDEHALVPLGHDTQQPGSSSHEIDDIQLKEARSWADATNLDEEDPHKRLMTVDAAIEVMAIMKEASEASSVLIPLKAVCGATIRVLEITRGNIVNPSISKEIVEKLEAHCNLFVTETTDLESREQQAGQYGLSSEFLAALKAYLRTLEQIRPILVERSQQQSKADSLLRDKPDAEVVKGFDGQIDGNFQELMRQVQTYNHRLIMETSSQLLKLRLSKLLDCAVEAQGERVKPLTQGTRLALIEHLNGWAKSNQSDKRLFWLHDEAGTGKSALAAHMANQWQADGVLAARFFFNKDGIRELHTILRFCVTLAKEMVTHHPFAEAAMLAKLETNQAIEYGNFSEVFESLVTSTADRLGEQLLTPLIFVVDALDECDEDDMRLLITTMMDALKRVGHVRFLLTSRPTKEIKALLEGAAFIGGSGVMLLDVKHGDIQRDLDTTMYVRQELVDFPIADQNVVIECAKGVFLWATLACSAVKRSIAPLKTLHRFEANTTMKPMNLIYEAVLDSALPRNSSHRDVKLLHSVLQGVALTYAPVSIFSIRAFYPEHKHERVDGQEYVEQYVNKLGSIMKDGTPHLPIYLLHPTFREFIETQHINSKYYISPPHGHHSIAMACLDLVMELTPDVFGGVTSSDSPLPVYRPSKSQSPMPLSLGEEAPLRYAIIFWAMHASLALTESEVVGKRIAPFFASQFLVWVEWFAALEETSECIEGLRSLRRNARTVALLGLPGVNDLLEKWSIDALRFVLRNSIMLEQCGLQAWMSALAFTPKQSLVYQTFHQRAIRPLPALLTGHADSFSENRILEKSRKDMTYASFSPDGKRLLSLSMSTVACLWNVKSSKLIRELTAKAVIVATFSSDGSLIATGGDDHIVCLLNGYSGTLTKKLPPRYNDFLPHHTSKVNSLVFALSDTVIVSVSAREDILRWTVPGTKDDMNPTPMQGDMHTDLMMGVVVSHDSKFVATFSNDMTVRLWDVEAAINVGEPMRGPHRVCSAAFSIDGTRIVAGYEDGKVIIWNTITQQLMHHLPHGTKSVYTIVMSPDRRIVAVCGSAFCLWNVDTGEMACPPLTGHADTVWGVAFNKEGNRMVSGSFDKTMRIWDIRCIGERIAVEGVTLSGHTKYINHVSMTPDGQMLASASGDGTLRLWGTDLLDTSSEPEPPDQVHGRTTHLLFSGDKTRLLSAGDNGTLQMWDFTTGRKIGGLLQSEQGELGSLCFSPCGTIWASGHTNGKVCLWRGGDDLVAPILHTLPGQTKGVPCMALAMDHEIIATGSRDGAIRVWDTRDYDRVTELKLSRWAEHIAISPDGTFIAAASDDEIKVWNLASRAMIQDPMMVSRTERRFGQWVDSMMFSPDGTAIISSNTTDLKIYDVYDKMQCFATFSLLNHKYYRDERLPNPTPTFSPDGRYLFCGPHAFDFANMSRLGHRIVFPAQAPEALALDPVSPLFLMRRHGQIHSIRWEEPILLIPPDINVDKGPWVAHKNTIAFGSYDGGVFIVRFPEESM